MSFCGYFLTALIVLKQQFSAAELSVPPAPTLTQTAIRGSSVELICQAPQGYGGLVFKLYKIRNLIDTKEHSAEQQSARFVLKGKDTEKENLYCCQYENSMYSFYIQPEPKEVVSLSPLPSPHLMVKPSSGHVMPGETLSFHCQAPPDHQKHPPEAFLLLRSAKGTPGSMVAPAKLVSQSHEAHFSVKTMGREDSGEYVCLYQLKLPKTGQVNSTASQPVHITVIELPVPTLYVYEGEVLECVGSPSYLQGFFSLFRMGVLSPEATHQASLTQHSARFPIPTHYEHGAQYQCQYSVSLGNYRAYSKMSMPVTLSCITGYHSCTQTSTGSTDLALIVGSVSAGVLFLMVVLILGFAMHRHIKNTSERRRQREREKFWLHVHSRDHIADLTLQRVDIGSVDTGGMLRGRPSDSEAIYDCPMTTFKNPSFC